MGLAVTPGPALHAVGAVAKYLDMAGVGAWCHDPHAFLPRSIDKVASIRARSEPWRVHGVEKRLDVLRVSRGAAMILDQQIDLRMSRLRRKLVVAIADTIDGCMIGWAGRAAVDADGLGADRARDIEPLLEPLN